MDEWHNVCAPARLPWGVLRAGPAVDQSIAQSVLWLGIGELLGQSVSGQSVSGQSVSGQSVSGQSVSGQSVSGQISFLPSFRPVCFRPVCFRPVCFRPVYFLRVSGANSRLARKLFFNPWPWAVSLVLSRPNLAPISFLPSFLGCRFSLGEIGFG